MVELKLDSQPMVEMAVGVGNVVVTCASAADAFIGEVFKVLRELLQCDVVVHAYRFLPCLVAQHFMDFVVYSLPRACVVVVVDI